MHDLRIASRFDSSRGRGHGGSQPVAPQSIYGDGDRNPHQDAANGNNDQEFNERESCCCGSFRGQGSLLAKDVTSGLPAYIPVSTMPLPPDPHRKQQSHTLS